MKNTSAKPPKRNPKRRRARRQRANVAPMPRPTNDTDQLAATAAAWVAAVTQRVRELARAVERVACLRARPGDAGAAALAALLDEEQFGAFSAAVEQAEMALYPGLLAAGAVRAVPDLAAACRAAAGGRT